jgi:hypothetical protein
VHLLEIIIDEIDGSTKNDVGVKVLIEVQIVFRAGSIFQHYEC